jgi:hypothetical protein
MVRLTMIAGFFLCHASAWAQGLNACDLNQDGVVNVVDIQLATNMALGLVPCGANVVAAGVCTAAVIQRTTAAVLTGACVTGFTARHSATLTWTASGSPNITGYNVYRATQTGGPYTKVSHGVVAGTSFTDLTVHAGQSYYYVTTAVDAEGNESVYSNQAAAVIPSLTP